MSGSEHPMNIAIVKCGILCSVGILVLESSGSRKKQTHSDEMMRSYQKWLYTPEKYMFSVFRYPIPYCWCQSTLFNFEFQNFVRTTSLEWPTHIGQWVHQSEGRIHCAGNIPAQQLLTVLQVWCMSSTPPGRYVIIQQPANGVGQLIIGELEVYSSCSFD